MEEHRGDTVVAVNKSGWLGQMIQNNMEEKNVILITLLLNLLLVPTYLEEMNNAAVTTYCALKYMKA